MLFILNNFKSGNIKNLYTKVVYFNFNKIWESKKIWLPHFISALFSVLIGKIITVYLNAEQYGIYSLQFVIFSFLSSFLFVPLVNGYKYLYDDYQKKKLLKFIRVLLGAVTILSFFILSILYYFTDYTDSSGLILITINLFLSGYYSLLLAKLNLDAKFKSFGVVSVAFQVFQGLFLLFMFFILDITKYSNIWLASIFASSMNILWLYSQGRKDINEATINKSIDGHKLFKYVFPLIILSIFTTVNNYMDRLIINNYLDLRNVGLYTAIYNLGSKMSLLTAPFIVFLNPIVYNRTVNNDSVIKSKLISVLKTHFLLSTIICLFLYFFYMSIGNLFLSNNFSESFYLLPYIAFGFIFINSVYIIETKFYGNGRINYILYHNILGAFINVIFNLLFIPNYGISGAALSGIISYLSQAILCFYFISK